MTRPQEKGEGVKPGPTLSQRTKAQQKALQRAMLRRIERELREQHERKAQDG